MKMKKMYYIPFLMVFLLFVSVLSSEAAVNVQCPCDLNQDGDCIDTGEPALADGVTCLHLGGGDGFARMADDSGRPQYIFSFADLTGIPDADVMEAGILAAAWPAPAIVLNQGDEFYLSLSNVGMLIRPDLFDPHTVHFHGFPQSSTVFDGLPESGLSINMGATLTYYYNLVEPGTYMYHCHVEATEHMQMGMLGNLYVRAAQSWDGYAPNEVPPGDLSECDSPGDQIQGTPCGYAYNDQDGSTAYDLEYPIQLGSFDPEFHDASWTVQPLPFAMMWDRYPMINGRGYPDTVTIGTIDQPLDPDTGEDLNGIDVNSQIEDSLIIAAPGERILLRLSNLNITVTHTLISPSIPMKVIGIDAKELRATDGLTPLHYTTNSVTMGGGMSVDVILDTTGVSAGTYYLYAANLQYLSNLDEDFGGMMTEIRIQ